LREKEHNNKELIEELSLPNKGIKGRTVVQKLDSGNPI
jgi:hypothetical protein